MDQSRARSNDMKQLSLTTEPAARRPLRESQKAAAVVLDVETEAQVVDLMARALAAIVRGANGEGHDDR
jgi:hypothetical protein